MPTQFMARGTLLDFVAARTVGVLSVPGSHEHINLDKLTAVRANYLSEPISYSNALSDLGQRARALRLLRNLTQAELARRAGVGVATVPRFERSGHASVESLLRLAVALGAEDGFGRLFELPKYESIDEALARPAVIQRKRVRRTR